MQNKFRLRNETRHMANANESVFPSLSYIEGVSKGGLFSFRTSAMQSKSVIVIIMPLRTATISVCSVLRTLSLVAKTFFNDHCHVPSFRQPFLILNTGNLLHEVQNLFDFFTTCCGPEIHGVCYKVQKTVALL